MIEKLQRVALREVWKHEALDFTKWLEENIDVLNDVLDLSLSSAESEQSAGAFSVDVLAEDEAGNPVVIENQLEASNHDHLGKLITYLTAIEARTAVWIVANPRPEHVRAMSWLNESSTASFYLVKVEAVKIADSPPAPLLTLIVGPTTEDGKGTTKRDLAERFAIRQRFWSQLLETARSRTKLHASVSPGIYGWVGASAGKYGLAYHYVVRQHDARVQFTIDRGKESKNENKEIFDALALSREAIEDAFGEPLDWDWSEGKRVCRIGKDIRTGGYRNEDKWPEIHEAMIDAMIRLENALKPHISELQI